MKSRPRPNRPDKVVLAGAEGGRGYKSVQWDARLCPDGGGRDSGGQASGLASGVYFYRLQAGNFVDVKKLILLK
ncbi:MAG: hypothetical protein AAB393_08085 [Bacteroidota bacterium]